MKKIELNNHIEIPQIGLGVFRTPSGEVTENAVKWALEAGYRHIDTTWIYGNEESVGKAIKASGIPREEIFLTTKLWNEDIRQRKTREAFETSLKLLQTDYIDLYLIHWPAEGYVEAWHEMEKLYKEGRIRAIGVSNFHAHHLETLAESSEIIPAVDQIESNPYFNNQALIDYCHSKEIQVEVWSPLGGTGGTILSDPVLQAIGKKYGKSPAQVVIRWHIQRNTIVLPKSVHQDRIIANLNVFDFTLSEDDMKQIDALHRNTRTGSDPETFNF
jgi:diketogulonate reductase-like aldo/keto reductase